MSKNVNMVYFPYCYKMLSYIMSKIWNIVVFNDLKVLQLFNGFAKADKAQ